MIPTTERWQRIAEIMEEAYAAYEQGLVALRKRVVEDMRRKLKEGGMLDRPHLGESLPPERPTPVVRRRRTRGRRSRRS